MHTHITDLIAFLALTTSTAALYRAHRPRPHTHEEPEPAHCGCPAMLPIDCDCPRCHAYDTHPDRPEPDPT